MPHTRHRVALEALDWVGVLPPLRLLASFRMALRPSRLLLALGAVVVLFAGVSLLDLALGPRVIPGEFENYKQFHGEAFEQWRADEQALAAQSEQPLLPLFRYVMETKLAILEQLTANMLGFEAASTGLAGATTPSLLHDLCIELPGWVASTYPGSLLAAMVLVALVLPLFGGAIARSSAVAATTGRTPPLRDALHYARRRYLSLLTAPLLPLLIAALMAIPLVLIGLLLYWPGLNIVAGLAAPVALAAGLAVAAAGIGLILAGGMLYPAVAVDDADAFDAASRVYSFAAGNLLRLLLYSLLALVWGVIAYLLVVCVLYAALRVAHVGVAAGFELSGAVAGSADPQVTTADALQRIYPPPRLGQLVYQVDGSALAGSERVAAVLVMLAVNAAAALAMAFVLSYYIAAQTWIYLLLRRIVDGVDYDELAPERPAATPPGDTAPAPAPQSAAS